MLVGEQPGDEEDKKGLPFVGRRGACSSVIDKQFKVSVMRGRFVDSPLAPYVFVRKALDRP
jgi:uracil-DNA glycosylase family 4